MEFRVSDSSGTDDDLPPSFQNRSQVGGRFPANGRPPVVVSSQLPKFHGDMETQIHNIEQEAYCSVLRAFKAQSDAITWEKESLITELRKELRVSDEEHRELLSRVNSDDIIRRIREWRKAGGLQPNTVTSQPVHDPVPSPTVSASRRKQKSSQPTASLALNAPSPGMNPPMQPPSSTVRRGPPHSGKNKKPKMHPSSGPSGVAPVPNRGTSGAFEANERTEAATYDPLIGRKVWTRWPEDNHFYEAVITDYKPDEGRHALVYDINTADETWEWVNLKEISPEDIRWEGEDPGIPRRGGRPGSGRGVKKSMGRGVGAATGGRGRGATKGHLKKPFPLSQNGIGQKPLGNVKVLDTDRLVKEVTRVFTSANSNPAEVEKAKKVLRDQEQALADAIASIGDLSDDGSDDGEHRMSQGQSNDQEQWRKQHYEEFSGEGGANGGSDINRVARG